MSLDKLRFRILYVDDNPALLQTLKMGLEADGFEVVAASNGVEALRLYEEQAGDFGAVVTTMKCRK